MAQTSYSLENLSHVAGARVAIVMSKWYGEYNRSMADACVEVLRAAGCEKPAIHVLPGCLEIPLAIRRLLKRDPALDAVIAFGIILKGDTYHFDMVKDLSMSGLEKVMFEFDTPIINEILPVTRIEDAASRAGNDDKNKGIEAGLAAVEIIDWRRRNPLT
jgi:6,7-dimethyl-8-ribityllumazine synthase